MEFMAEIQFDNSNQSEHKMGQLCQKSIKLCWTQALTTWKSHGHYKLYHDKVIRNKYHG